MLFRLRIWAPFALASFGLCGAQADSAETNAFDPPALYLTWQHDPTSTMTIQWQTIDGARAEVYYRKLGESDWKKTTGESHPLPASVRTVHFVEVSGLLAAADYEFCFALGEKIFKFRTMP